MDDNAAQQLMEMIRDCMKTARNLLDEYESLLQKQKSTDATGDSDHSEATSLVGDVNKRLKEIDLALKSNKQQLKFALEAQVEPYLATQPALPTFTDGPVIQSDDNQMEVANVTINQQVKLLNDNTGKIEAKLNLSVHQALFTGTLPDDFYLHLLSVIGIQECLLSNRRVCSLWNELVLERCRNQKSLKVFETFDNLMEYGELLLKYEKTDDTSLILKSIGDDLLFEGLETDHNQLITSLNPDVILTREKKREASKVLTVLFPKVEELVLCPEFDETLIDTEHLLQFYAEQLTSLTMTTFEEFYRSLSDKLRALDFPLLRSLNTFNCSLNEGHLLYLLPQLESLTLARSDTSLEGLLRTGTQLQELNIKNINSVYSKPVAEFSKRPPINANLRKFSFVATQNEVQLLELISQNMTTLEALKMDLILFRGDTVSRLHSLSSYLVPLTQLHSLTLEARVSFFLLDDNQLTMIKPLPSVRHLKLLLWDYDSLPLESMDLFSRSLFAAFPKIEQALIGFVGYEDADEELVDDGLLYAETLAAFEDFAGKHPNIVQLFRSKDMSRFTACPNAVSPLLGHHRQVYEEYIEEEELFGVAICKLAASLVPRQGEECANLKIALRPADRLTAMSNLLQLLESGAFAFNFEKANHMLRCMLGWALGYGASQVALFRVTCKSVLFLLDCRLVDETPFLLHEDCQVYSLFEMIVNLVEHYRTQQLDEKSLLIRLCKRMVMLLKEFDSIRDDEQFDDYDMFKGLLELADYYKAEQLHVLDQTEELLLQIHSLIDDQLEKFKSEERLSTVISKLIRSENRAEYQVEMECALTRCCKSTDGYFELLSREVEGDSSGSDSGDRIISDSSESDSSDGDSSEGESSESDSSDSTISDGSSSSAESEP